MITSDLVSPWVTDSRVSVSLGIKTRKRNGAMPAHLCACVRWGLRIYVFTSLPRSRERGGKRELGAWLQLCGIIYREGGNPENCCIPLGAVT